MFLKKSRTWQVLFFTFIFFCLWLSPKPIIAAETGNITGTVFKDLNVNDTLDIGEAKLANWQINLIAKDQIIQTAVTDSNGRYYFNNLAAGNYQVQINLQNSWTSVGLNKIDAVVVAGQVTKTDFANYQMATASFSGGPMIQLHTVSITKLSPTSAKITWFTTHPATSQVVFGQQSRTGSQMSINDNKLSYSFTTAVDFSPLTYHAVILSGLAPNTTYYFRPVSLPDPRQWQNASRLLGDELSFTTDSAVETKDLSIISSENQAINKSNQTAKPRLADQTQVLGDKTTEPEITVSQDQDNAKISVLGDNLQNVINSVNCLVYIWLLLILDLLVIIYVYWRDKKSQIKSRQKVWWLIAIFTLVPFIMGYPDCWLTAWLIIILAIIIIYLMATKNKPKPPTEFFGPAGAGALMESISSDKNVSTSKGEDRVEPTSKS
ncbi:MAG: SdrD B-like domain-containing protein [Patescibacteria group bacterium]